MTTITVMPLRAYADGGCIGINPSPDGGTWAFRLIGFGEVILAERSGIVLPAEAGLPTISNNYTELLACLRALQSLPDGWEESRDLDNCLKATLDAMVAAQRIRNDSCMNVIHSEVLYLLPLKGQPACCWLTVREVSYADYTIECDDCCDNK